VYDRRFSDAPDADKVDKEAERLAPPLSAEELEEKEQLLSQGFSNWTRKDLNNFIRGLEEHGRDNIRDVATLVEGKAAKEVGQYAACFFQRYTEMKDWEKLMRRIEAGDSRILRRHELDAALAKKVASLESPWTSLRIDYSLLGSKANGGAQTAWTVDGDRHLVCLACQCGFGKWEDLQKEVRRSWLFRFDWWAKTRTQAELGKRVEYLARLVEKELEDDAEAAKKAKRQNGGGSSKAGAKRSMEEDDEDAGGGKAKRRKD